MLFIVDTETTDLKPGKIIQMSYIMVELGNVVAKNFYFNVGKISPKIQEIIKLDKSIEELSGGKVFKDHELEIYNDISRASVIIAHNVKFDMRFIHAEFGRVNKELAEPELFCTMNNGKTITNINSKRGLKNPKMGELCATLGVDEESIRKVAKMLFKEPELKWHDARMDVTADYLCFRKMTNI